MALLMLMVRASVLIFELNASGAERGRRAWEEKMESRC